MAGEADRNSDDFNPGRFFCESLAVVVSSLAVTQLSSPRRR